MPIATYTPRTPRNQKCPCGSGIKFKKCCLNQKAAANSH
ncbi:MAG: SEC-C domain-containing protein [Bryobacterales bacterium]|nr:SEC-C domain-containing protein [Bryobacterales bacterium]